MDLKDKTALVTGATSGIGRAIALELARDGASVIVSGRDGARGAETVAAIEAEGGDARFVAADLGDLDSVAHLAREAADADVLINNAGVFAFMPTADQDVESFESMFDINVRGTFFLTAALAPKMAERGEGSIVNITTMAAEVGMVGGAAYGASKAARRRAHPQLGRRIRVAQRARQRRLARADDDRGHDRGHGGRRHLAGRFHRPAQPPRPGRGDRPRRELHRLAARQLRHGRDLRGRRRAGSRLTNHPERMTVPARRRNRLGQW